MTSVIMIRGPTTNPSSHKERFSPIREFIPDQTKLYSSNHHINNEKKAKGKANKCLVDNAHFALRPVIIIAQCISLLPLYRALTNDHNDIKFVLKSIKCLWSLIMIAVTGALGCLTVLRLPIEGLSYRTLGDLMFYAATCCSMIFFFHLASKWKDLMIEWSKVEEVMNHLDKINIARRIKIIASVVMTSSLCEHLLANSETLLSTGNCSGEVVHKFYLNAFKQVFAFTEFSLWKGIALSAINFIVTMTWNFTDLFIMAISIAISSRFNQINKELDKTLHKNMPLHYWRKTREMYNRMALLTKTIDKKLSFIVFLSFSNNLYFICLQLLNSLKPIQSTMKVIYFFASFTHLLFRTCAVCLTASNIYDNSKQPLTALFSVSSETYNIEVQRLVTQVSFDTLALTGCRFFAITRTLMLTVAGTIVTYEIVLVQFNALSSDGMLELV